MRYIVLATFMLIASAAHAAPGVHAVPTYESVGLYWTDPPFGWTANGCQVRYRTAGQSAWRQGHDLWFDTASSQCRGSIVNLTPGTQYEAELSVPAGKRTITFRTWPDRVPVARTVDVPSGSSTLVITAGGSPSGYVVYQGKPGMLDAKDRAAFNIYIDASYVVVRGFTLRGASQDAIRISPNATDVIIEDNEITGWGRTRGGGLGVNLDSAIRAICSDLDAKLTRVTIQRNEIHDPRYGTNSWSDGHPEGPQGITFDTCPGNHVIRHNEIFSTTGRYLNDGIGGSENLSTTGFPNADSDIYGNSISHVWDDAIEAEGGNMNVRIWGNYMDQTATAVASTITSVGPIYLFRNVWNRARTLEKEPLDGDNRQPMFKAGSHQGFADGRRYIYHNTMLQAQEGATDFPLGGAMGVSGTGPSQRIRNTVTRNNIWHTWRPYDIAWAPFEETIQADPGNDFGWDMYNGTDGSTIRKPIIAAPLYAPGNGWKSEEGGMYQLAPGSPGSDQGVPIPNFNDGYRGAAPDVGAHEGGTARMKFGIGASATPAAGR
ncbi:MAG TPA: hypothetical protein VFV90_06805 [Usitatibacter sp.]|nr:hypothetical protein [Usitatibacter sp.]